MTKKHPLQPLELDKNGVLRFKQNKIVNTLLECASAGKKLDLNDIAMIDFSQEDRAQFAQLIGYSLSGYGDLSYVDNETYDAADKTYREGLTESEARIKDLEEKLASVREQVRDLASTLFRISPDDLEE